MPEVARYEPRVPLFAGPDGLDVIRGSPAARAAARASSRSRSARAGGAVEALLREAGFAEVERVRDLAGIERVVVGRR
jgi:release factor glutamine methyltransferase